MMSAMWKQLQRPTAPGTTRPKAMRTTMTKATKRAILLGSLMLLGGLGHAQLSVSPQTDAQELARAITGPGVQISNVLIDCHSLGYGEFSYTGNVLGVEEGVLLTTGTISNAVGPNNVENKTFEQNTPGSPLLNIVTGRTTYDACRFEFDVIPGGDTLRFNFAFASEEYNEWVGSQYNDVFGFFISGPGIAGDPGIAPEKNIALIPGTNNAVTINNVNNGSNPTYYYDNVGGPQIQYDGVTQDLQAMAVVQPCQTYRLKLIVADASDRKYDSGVFIERIESNAVTIESFTASGFPNLVEGCNAGSVRFTRQVVSDEAMIVPFFLGGTASNGVDYPLIGDPDPLVAKFATIPANVAHVDVLFDPIADGIVEGIENIRVYLGSSACPGSILDSLDLFIQDSLYATVNTPDAICPGGSAQLQAGGGMTYAWSPATGLNATDIAAPMASPSATTTYQVTVSAGACNETISTTVTVSNITLGAAVTQPLCQGGVNGAVNLSANGGQPPYTFGWTGPNGFSSASEDLVNVGHGTYTVTVTDAVGCTRVQSFNVNAPSALQLSSTAPTLPFGQNISCAGGLDGSVDLTVVGGTAPYTYVWNGPGGFTANTQDLNGIGAGTYTVTVTDVNGCTANTERTLAEPTALAPGFIDVFHTACANAATGSATATANGGMPPYAFIWNTMPPQSTATASALAAGEWTVTITDGYGCQSTGTVSIEQTAAPITVGFTNVSNVIQCQGQGNPHGTATAAPAGGTPPFTFAWNTIPPQSTATADFNSGGVWTVTVTDANGCTASNSVTVTQPGQPTVTVSSQSNSLCHGDGLGSATVQITGGSNVQSITWNTAPPQSGATASGLEPGTYIVTAIHADGCQTVAEANIGGPSEPLEAIITNTIAVQCFGDGQGSATVGVTGGTAPYSYAWDTTPPQDGATATDLPAGTWTVTVTDANGCTTTATATISGPVSPLQVSATVTSDVLCYNGSEGSASALATGGTGPYTYTWDTAPVQNGPTASGLTAGTWTVTATDANGCTSSAGVTIDGIDLELEAWVETYTNISCFGSEDGSITITILGGSGSYSVIWDTDPPQSGPTATGLAPGNYLATVTDNNGCVNPKFVAFTITGPDAPLDLTVLLSDHNGFHVSCFNGDDGSIDVTVTGGTFPYTYLWTDDFGNFTGVEDLHTLGPDNFYLTVTDAGGCVIDTAFFLTSPPQISVIADIITAACQGSPTGAIDATVSGGLPPYVFSWSGPGGFSSNALDLTDLEAGVYTLHITDDNGCTHAQVFDVSEPGVFNITAMVASYPGGWNVSCANATDGSIDVTITGGTGPYTYGWTGPGGFTSDQEDLSGIGSGNYLLTITDDNGCSTIASYDLQAPAPLSISLAPLLVNGFNISCNSANDGGIDATITGGTVLYDVQWNGPGGFNAQIEDIYGLAPGTYTLNVTDENGCEAQASVLLNQPDALDATATTSTFPSGDQVACNGSITGSITLNITGGVAPHNVAWEGPGGYTGSGATIMGLGAGSYQATITDANGCTMLEFVTLTDPDAVDLDITISTFNGSEVSCAGASDGMIDIIATGGAGGFTFAWSGPAGFTSNAASISGLAAGDYAVTITDANGCVSQENFTLNAPDALAATTDLSDYNGSNVSCMGNSDGTIDLSIMGGTVPVTVEWTAPDDFTSDATELTGLATGIYTATITDANGCELIEIVTLIGPDPIAIDLSISVFEGGTNVSCAGAADGAVGLVVIGGTGPYTYSWTDGLGFVSSDPDISGLAPGTYQVIVTDANGCTTSDEVTLEAPDPIDIVGLVSELNGSNVSCDGATDGSITLTVNGGTAPYDYSWSNGADTQDPGNLGADTYEVTVTDANGCVATSIWTLSAPDAVSVAATVLLQPGGFGTTCHGAADGSITTTIAGGTLPYTILWNGPNGFSANTADITDLQAGGYQLIVTDANGCTNALTTIVSQPAPIVVQLQSVTWNGDHHIPCFGDAAGAVSAGITGGIPGYDLEWNGPNGFTSTDEALNGMSSGVYTLIVTDSNGCSAVNSITLTEPAPLDVSAMISDLPGGFQVSCAGNDGSIDITVNGGTPVYQFSWTGPNGFGSTAMDLDGLGAGAYHLVVTDANGCIFETNFDLTAPEPISASFSTTPNICPGDATGAIGLVINGGAGPYAQTWSGPDGFSSNDISISGLGAGTYMVEIVDALGCGGTFTTALNGPAPIESGTYVSFYGQYNIQCVGDSTGVIELTPQGGTGPYSVQVNGPGGYSSTANAMSGLAAGTYLVHITDAHGCTMDTTIVLTEPQLVIEVSLDVSVYPSGTNVSCYGASDGWINATVNGGSGDYTFLWRGPDSLEWTTPFIDGLPAGDYAYELVVTDGNQCTYFTEVTLTQPDAPISATLTVSEYAGGYNVPCSDAVNGSIDTEATGGNGGFTYVWSGPDGYASTDPDISGLAPGVYALTITDINGCELVQNVVITAPEPLTISLDIFNYPGGSQISCHGAGDGSITATVDGGTPDHVLSWSGPGGFSSSDAAISDLGPGTYCLSVTDANGCQTQECYTITQPGALSVNLTTEIAACGQATGAVNTTVSGGTAPLQYAWTNGAATEDLTGLIPGTYGVVITDANGCNVVNSITVTGTPAVEAGAVIEDNLCHGGSEGTIALEVTSGTAPFTYAWNNGSNTSNLEGLTSGNYTVTVTDANGCQYTNSWSVGQNDAIVMDTTLSVYNGGYNISHYQGADGSIDIWVSGGTAPYTYAWSTGANTASIDGLPAGTYVVEVTDANGCTAVLTVVLTQPSDLLMPTGFSPNGDGANDWFVIQGLDAYPSNTFVVLNRWGNVVYDRLNYRNDWGGENAQARPLPNGTYFVILKVNDGARTMQGFVDLRR